MLTNVHIKNLALIREAEIDFSTGLNILTGETGSGKSMIIGAVNIALGGKASRSMIRKGADHALIQLQFADGRKEIMDVLEKLDIPADGDNVIITRKITPDSGITKVNGENITLNNLKKITSLLVDVHGQHEHQSLLDTSKQLAIIDRFAGSEAAALRAELLKEYEHYKELKKQMIASFNMDEESLKRETELLKHELNEITSAAPAEGEDDALEAEFKRLSSSEEILSSVNRAGFLVSDEDTGAVAKIGDALKHIGDAAALDEELKDINSQLLDADSLLKEIRSSLSAYISENAFDAERLDEVRSRLDLINHLKSRYGGSIGEINKYAKEAEDRLESLADYNKNKDKLLSGMRESAVRLNGISRELSEKRHTAAAELEKLIVSNLMELNFPEVDFRIEFSRADKISSNGFDKVEFLISMNPGEAPAPLRAIASGGELSRIMLALKCSLAQSDGINTLIFDEIDTGISGSTAQKVAEKLNELGRKYQVICITHLPQIAAMGDHHYKIHKSVEEGSTISGIEMLDEEESIKEIAGLLGGAKIGGAAYDNAKELKAQARMLKM